MSKEPPKFFTLRSISPTDERIKEGETERFVFRQAEKTVPRAGLNALKAAAEEFAKEQQAANNGERVTVEFDYCEPFGGGEMFLKMRWELAKVEAPSPVPAPVDPFAGMDQSNKAKAKRALQSWQNGFAVADCPVCGDKNGMVAGRPLCERCWETVDEVYKRDVIKHGNDGRLRSSLTYRAAMDRALFNALGKHKQNGTGSDAPF